MAQYRLYIVMLQTSSSIAVRCVGSWLQKCLYFHTEVYCHLPYTVLVPGLQTVIIENKRLSYGPSIGVSGI